MFCTTHPVWDSLKNSTGMITCGTIDSQKPQKRFKKAVNSLEKNMIPALPL
jgi:hypothetical protein